MKHHQSTIGKNDEWLTPIEIIKSLGVFDLDPCICERAWKDGYYENTIKNALYSGGLESRWLSGERVWMNPPFNRYERHKWMAKMANHNNGIMLVPAACETEAFYNYVWGKASGILFLKGRPHFHYADGVKASANSGCTICLVSYGLENLTSLQKSALGFVIDISNQINNSTP